MTECCCRKPVAFVAIGYWWIRADRIVAVYPHDPEGPRGPRVTVVEVERPDDESPTLSTDESPEAVVAAIRSALEGHWCYDADPPPPARIATADRTSEQ